MRNVEGSGHRISAKQKLRRSPTKCVAIGFVFQPFLYSIFKLRSGCDIVY